MDIFFRQSRLLRRGIGKRISVALLFPAFILPLLFTVRPVFAIPWEVIPSGKIGLEYDQRFGTASSSYRFVTRLDAAAVGFVLDKQLFKYAADAGTSIYTGSNPSISERNLYRFDLNLTFLDLYSSSAWKLRRLPHPIFVWYQRYQDGNATTSGFGGSIHWHLPLFIQLMNEDRFITLSTSSGRKKDKEEGGQMSGQQEWEQVWNNQQQFQNQGWQGQQGDLEGWDEDLGPTGWGNSSAQWGMDEDKEPEKEKKPGRTGPLFSMPFPSMMLSGSLSQREEDDLTITYDRANFNMQTHDLHYSLMLDFTRNGVDRSYSGPLAGNDNSSAQNTLRLRHEYDGETRKSGNSERKFRMTNGINVLNRSTLGASEPVSYQYKGAPYWQWFFPADNTEFLLDSDISLSSSEDVTTYTASGRAKYVKEFSPLLTTQAFTGAGYQDTSNADSSTLVANAGGRVDWNISRYLSSQTELSLQYTSTAGGEGTLGFTGSAMFYLNAPVIVTSILDFGYDAQDKRNNPTPENPLTGQTTVSAFGTVSSMFVEERLSASGRLYKGATWRTTGSYRIEERQNGLTENTLRLGLNANAPITRYASASAGAYYQSFQTDITGGTSERQNSTFFANLNARPFRGLSAFIRYRLIASSASSSDGSGTTEVDRTDQNITFSAQYERQLGRILASITYRTDFRLTDKGSDITDHRILVTAERRFGFRPRRY